MQLGQHMSGMAGAVGRKKIRVLIVEDHELVRVGVRTLLEREPDIEIVAEASTGGQALEQARRLRPEVVLLDAYLPDMPGSAVCRSLTDTLPSVVVAILTTFTDDALVRDCVRAGARGYLVKDISRLELAESIHALASGEAVFDRKVLPKVLAVARQSSAATESDLPLTERQRLILRLVAEGLSNRQIAGQIHLSELTVKSYVEELLRQLGARNRVHAAILAVRNGWL